MAGVGHCAYAQVWACLSTSKSSLYLRIYCSCPCWPSHAAATLAASDSWLERPLGQVSLKPAPDVGRILSSPILSAGYKKSRPRVLMAAAAMLLLAALLCAALPATHARAGGAARPRPRPFQLSWSWRLRFIKWRALQDGS